jgi:hypothetical protein
MSTAYNEMQSWLPLNPPWVLWSDGLLADIRTGWKIENAGNIFDARILWDKMNEDGLMRLSARP